MPNPISHCSESSDMLPYEVFNASLNFFQEGGLIQKYPRVEDVKPRRLPCYLPDGV